MAHRTPEVNQRTRFLAALLLPLLLLGLALPVGPVRGADTTQFRAGSIISDELFYSGGDLDEAEIQSFLDTVGARCVPSPTGVPCLKDYRTTTATRPADARCAPYQGATNEPAARVIAKVSQACGISARVLLVLLQKEQGLVLASGASLTTGRYQAATGYGCPDGAPCSTQYHGFSNQVYMAAARFREYSQNPARFRHQPGAWNFVLYHPSASCGSSNLFIVNRATAGLYNYTPYQPNAASLAAGSGTGDGCSSYGNRNFWRYFTDWFGETQLITTGAINRRFWSGGQAALGPPVANQTSIKDGIQQAFRRGHVYSGSSGAFATTGAMEVGYQGTGGPSGPLGLPTGEQVSMSAATIQQAFQNGHAYVGSGHPFGTTVGAIDQRYTAQGGTLGTLGWPQGSQRCEVGCILDLRKSSGQMVSIVWSSGTGAHVLASAIRATWLAHGGADGLGLPVTDEGPTSDRSGSVVEFVRGNRTNVALWSSTHGTHVFGGAIRDAWYRSGDVRGLGYAAADETAIGDGVGSWAPFERAGRNGRVVWSPETGAHFMAGAFLARWESESGVRGLGYPTSDEARAADGTGSVLTFRRGSRPAVLLWHPDTGVHAIGGAVYDAWRRSGGVHGLGYPTTDEALTKDGDGAYAEFRRGTLRGIILWSPRTGAAYLSGPALDLWTQTGGLASLGYPMGDERLTGLARSTVTRFSSGYTIVADPEGATVLVPPPIADSWSKAGGATGRFGLPLGPARQVGPTLLQDFAGGTLTAPAA